MKKLLFLLLLVPTICLAQDAEIERMQIDSVNLGGKHIKPKEITTSKLNLTDNFSILSGKKLFLDGGTNSYLWKQDSTALAFVINGVTAMGWRTADQATLIPAGIKLFLDGGGNTYLQEGDADRMYIYANGNLAMGFYGDVSTNYTFHNLNPIGTTKSCGSSTEYFSTINYNTLTKRGGWGFFDGGVELQDGRIVSDCEAILQLKEDTRGKKTPYGKNIIDQRTLPKAVYIPATNTKGKLYPRDAKGYSSVGEDGEDVNAMMSIMIGAIKELTLRVKVLEAKVKKLEKK